MGETVSKKPVWLFIWHSHKGKTIVRENRLVVSRVRDGRGCDCKRAVQERFRADGSIVNVTGGYRNLHTY